MYASIVPELSGGGSMGVYQIIALCGTAENLTSTMEKEMWLFGRTFQHIEDLVFEHNVNSALYTDWHERSFRPVSNLHPRLLKTSSVENFPKVLERLKEVSETHEIELTEGMDALGELRGVMKILKDEGIEDFDVVYR